MYMAILLDLLSARPGATIKRANMDTREIHAGDADSNYDNFDKLVRYYQQQLTDDEVLERHSQATLSGDRQSAQPMNRNILARRKQTVLHAINGHSADGKGTGDGDVTSRVLDDLLGQSPTMADTFMEEASSHNRTATPSSQGGDSFRKANYEPGAPSHLLASPWWVRIKEEHGGNGNSFVPISRRAASSVVYTQKTVDREDKKRRDLLLDRMDASKNSTDCDLILNKKGERVGNVNPSTKSRTNDNSAGINSTSGDIMRKQETPKDYVIKTIHVDTKERILTGKETHRSQTTKSTIDSKQHQEFMIISGGYTDDDWKTFPVYAFPLTSSARTGSGEWIDLSPHPTELPKEGNAKSWCDSQDNFAARDRFRQEAKYFDMNVLKNKNMTDTDPWAHADPCAPLGRMGHSSFVYNNYLYVFGGLIYDAEQAPTGSGNKESFRLEDVPYMYRLDIQEMFEARKVTASTNNRRDRRRSEDKSLNHDLETLLEENHAIQRSETHDSSSESIHVVKTSNRKVKGWQRIIPRVKPFPTDNESTAMTASEVLIKLINRGEMQGGLWNGKFVMYGGLRIALLDGTSPRATSTVIKGPSHATRGSSQISSRVIEFPLGDVWAYDIKIDAFEKITNDFGDPVSGQVDTEDFVDDKADNYYDDKSWSEFDEFVFPRPRTAHAATVVGDELVIHGGMGWNRQEADWDRHTKWETYDDLWILDLTTLQWKQRFMLPSLACSYHSLVGYDMKNLMGWGKEFVNFTSWDGPVVAAFGGYTNGIDIFSGEVVTYVSDDLLVSFPAPVEGGAFGGNSLWLKASNPDKTKYPEMISNRVEHVAVMSNETGSMFVWGGQRQDTSNVKGVWMMNLAGRGSRVSFEQAEDYGIYDEYWATSSVLHAIVIMIMFLSITLKILLELTKWCNEVILGQSNERAALSAFEDFTAQDFAGDAAPDYSGDRGLHPQIISTIPEKVYRSKQNNDSSVEEDSKQDDCCPICLGGSVWR
eukprot:CCRYP_006007-RA/>CCRYP_006007-RA protein AED:0.02 eAED:0.02 QI:220/1/1/1/1/1/4/699/987